MIVYCIARQPFLKDRVDWAPAKIPPSLFSRFSWLCYLNSLPFCFLRKRGWEGYGAGYLVFSRYSLSTYSGPGPILKGGVVGAEMK